MEHVYNITDDSLYEIMLQLDLNSIKSLCNTYNKQVYIICKSNYFWKNKILHDGLMIFDDLPKTMQDYEIIYTLTQTAISYLPTGNAELYFRYPGDMINYLPTK